MGPISPAHTPALFEKPPLHPSHPTPLDSGQQTPTPVIKVQRRLQPWGGDYIQPYGRFKRAHTRTAVGGRADWKQDDNGVIKPESLKKRGSGDLESGSRGGAHGEGGEQVQGL